MQELFARPEVVSASEEASPPTPVRPRVSMELLSARIRDVDPSLDPAGPTFRAALILLAGLEVRQNVDRLARITRNHRSFVAKCARRLVDNGVWRGGETVADWTAEGPAHPAFWRDVAVAEGKLCRRIDHEGIIEWAAPGEWNKSYDFVEREPHTDTCVRYYVPAAVPVPDVESEYGAEPSAASADSGTDDLTTPLQLVENGAAPTRKYPVRGWRAARRFLVLAHRLKPAPNSKPAGAISSQPRQKGVGGLFPDAIWLG